mmetsp:Transcript_32385/g.86880  ORF Transcript_32385/g.86880 Transcript_32385/m.86880 type:complete len:210 (+) Transcript_32385:981-1610(+)
MDWAVHCDCMTNFSGDRRTLSLRLLPTSSAGVRNRDVHRARLYVWRLLVRVAAKDHIVVGGGSSELQIKHQCLVNKSRTAVRGQLPLDPLVTPTQHGVHEVLHLFHPGTSTLLTKVGEASLVKQRMPLATKQRSESGEEQGLTHSRSLSSSRLRCLYGAACLHDGAQGHIERRPAHHAPGLRCQHDRVLHGHYRVFRVRPVHQPEHIPK